MTWKDEDEVVTTYGSLQLGLEQAHAAGVKTERERIIKLLEEMRDACLSVTSKIGDHNAWTLENAIALIKGENK
jgi:hypothetical protein